MSTNTSERTELVSFNPATGEAVDSVPVTAAQDMPGIVERARTAQIAWAKLSIQERAEIMTAYNFKSRLVGNDGFLYAEGGGQSQDISTNSMLRCNNCPSNECEDCPCVAASLVVRHRRCERASPSFPTQDVRRRRPRQR